MHINCMNEIPWSNIPGKPFIEYIELSILLIKRTGIDYDDFGNDPISLSIKHLDGEASDEERAESAGFWFNFIEKDVLDSGIRNRDNDDVIKARLALGLLATEKNKDNYSDSLDWIMIFLGKYGADDDELWGHVEGYFSNNQVAQKVKDEFFSHIERSFGRIQNGWKLDNVLKNVQVVKTCPENIDDSEAYVTLGLSNFSYPLIGKENYVRVELFILLLKDMKVSYVPSIIEDVIGEMNKRGRAFLRGEVIGPKGKLFDGSEVTALYVAPPMCLDDAANGFIIDQEEVLFMWLVPITDSESGYIKKYGWEAFEDKLELEEVDVIDVFRKSVV